MKSTSATAAVISKKDLGCFFLYKWGSCYTRLWEKTWTRRTFPSHPKNLSRYQILREHCPQILGKKREWQFWLRLMACTFLFFYCAFICKDEALKHGIRNDFEYISRNQYNTKFFFAYWLFLKSLWENCFIRRLTKLKENEYTLSRKLI